MVIIMKVFKKTTISVLLFIIFNLTIFSTSTYASFVPYNNYIYNPDNKAVTSQVGYKSVLSVTEYKNESITISLKNPTDFYKGNNKLYILDSGNKRVVVLDENLKLNSVVDKFYNDEAEITLSSPTGIFVDKNEKIYIADPGNAAVFIFDLSGKLLTKLTKPNTDMISDKLEFKPTKVICDTGGNAYVIATGVYQGAIIYDNQGIFRGFFGNNKVEGSLQLLNDMFWKRLLTKEQSDKLAKYTPDEFDNFDIDNENFVYTSTQASKVWTNRVKKLNPMGVNVFKNVLGFGELENVYKDGKYFSSTIVDINIDDFGFINVVDNTYGRVYQYDSYGRLVFIFGGLGFQEGNFVKPIAIESIGEKILVLDRDKHSITVFEMTDFGQTVHKALKLFNEGRYDEAQNICHEILKLDRNYYLAYQSIGKALYEKGEYKSSLDYFKRAKDKQGNSDAFKEYRDGILRKLFLFVLFGIVLFIFLIVLIKNKISKIKNIYFEKLKRVLKSVIHPYSQFEELKYKKGWSIPIAITILIIYFLTTAANIQLTGFRFNSSNDLQVNILLCFMQTIPIFVIWCFVNWSVCTLLEGKGRLIEIAVMSSYCLIPYIVSQHINIILSHFLTLDESIFITAIGLCGFVWSGIMLLCGLSAIHQYGFKKTILSVIFSFIGMLVAVFIMLLVSELIWQGILFAVSIIFELIYRLNL